MDPKKKRLGRTVLLSEGKEQSRILVEQALKKEGFGILTEIDVKETLKKKIDVDFRPYWILGACNPPLAHRALKAAPEAGLLLPCNVTIAEVDANHTEVSIIDPLMMTDFSDSVELMAVAIEAKERLDRVAAELEES
ncbi:MAG: DUF302 domain-containing protein [Candidatus Promineifilaceae bacterium]